MNKDCTIVIPTYYPGQVILNLLKTIPKEFKVIILDNANDAYLSDVLKSCGLTIQHLKLGDIGLGKSFNKALSIINTELIFLTQPDVILQKNCIENLIKTFRIYSSAAIIAPLIYDGNEYSQYDYYDLKISKFKKLLNTKKSKFIKKNKPSGDISVEAVNSTALLLDVKKIKEIGGWDDNFYTYLEDIDLCLRLRQSGYEIIKSPNAHVVHAGFSSHKNENRQKMNISRNWNFTWSSLYFYKKHKNKLSFIVYFNKIFFKYLFKILINIILNRKYKLKIYQIRFGACLDFFNEKKYLDSKYKKNIH